MTNLGCVKPTVLIFNIIIIINITQARMGAVLLLAGGEGVYLALGKERGELIESRVDVVQSARVKEQHLLALPLLWVGLDLVNESVQCLACTDLSVGQQRAKGQAKRASSVN